MVDTPVTAPTGLSVQGYDVKVSPYTLRVQISEIMLNLEIILNLRDNVKSQR